MMARAGLSVGPRSSAVATSREDQRQPRSGRAAPLQRGGRERADLGFHHPRNSRWLYKRRNIP